MPKLEEHGFGGGGGKSIGVPVFPFDPFRVLRQGGSGSIYEFK